MLAYFLAVFFLSSCTALPDCFFIHGAGEEDWANSTITPTFVEYWGNVHKYVAPYCNKTEFIHLASRDYEFYHPLLTKTVCSYLTGSSASGAQVRNKIIYTHSMGNLVLSYALQQKVCTFTDTTYWYAASPPTYGSRSIEVLEQVCTNPQNNINSTLGWLAHKLHYCVDHQVRKSYTAMLPNSPQLKGLDTTLSTHADGIICGNDPFGEGEKYGIGLTALDNLVQWHNGEKSDGMVDFHSCRGVVPRDWFVGDPQSPYYLQKLNHADTTCKVGDKFDLPDGIIRAPCAWYASMALRAVEGRRGRN